MINYQNLISLVAKIKTYITPETDFVWSNFNSVQEIHTELDRIIEMLVNNKPRRLDNLLFLIAPTGSFQEISISHGWGEEFIEIANQIEREMGIS